MNGIEKILEHISQQSASECEAIAQEAAGECQRILEDYAKAEQDEYTQLLSEGKAESERRLDRMNSLAALESKKHVLSTQQDMIAAAFELAASKLLALPEPEYVEFLAKLACTASLNGNEVIVLSEADHGRIGSKVLDVANSILKTTGREAALTLSDEYAGIRGGLILVGGKIEANCSIDSLVAQCRNELLPRVAAELFD